MACSSVGLTDRYQIEACGRGRATLVEGQDATVDFRPKAPGGFCSRSHRVRPFPATRQVVFVHARDDGLPTCAEVGGVVEQGVNGRPTGIRRGHVVETEGLGIGKNALEGRVMAINPKVDENGLVQVTLTLKSSKNLLPGMNARAIIRAPQRNSLVVPKDAVVYRSGRAVIFTIENGKESKWNYVEVGRDNGREIEVLDGIPENSTVITTNNLQLAHQAPVQIVTD